jgi:hypothetical protein
MIFHNKLKVLLTGLFFFSGIISWFAFNNKQEQTKPTFVICSDLDLVLLQKMKGISFNRRKPIIQTWALYKHLHDNHDIDLFLWTNNPIKQCNNKLNHVAKKYALTLQWAGKMCARRSKGIKKPKANYYFRAYNYTMRRLQQCGRDISNTYLIFIDDKVKNVIGAQQVAQKHGLRLIALRFICADKLTRDLQNYIE